MRTYSFALIAAVLLAGCSEPPKAAKKIEPLKPLTGREAFQQMYPQARSWMPDAQPLQIKSVPLQEVKAEPGRSGGWQVVFVSPGRNKIKTFTWSAIESQGNMHQGVFGGPEESWSGSGQAKPFAVQAIKVDTDDAYETAAKKSEDYIKKNPNKPVVFLAEFTPRFPDTTWRVIWGESVGTSDYSVFIDATTGQFLEKMH